MTPKDVYDAAVVTRDRLLETGFSIDVVEVAVSALLAELLPLDQRTRFESAVLQRRKGDLMRAVERTFAGRRPPDGLWEVVAAPETKLALVMVPDELAAMLMG
jgi:hypothetical protein